MGVLNLSRSDRLALVFFFASACLVFLAWAFPNMSRIVRPAGCWDPAGRSAIKYLPTLCDLAALALSVTSFR